MDKENSLLPEYRRPTVLVVDDEHVIADTLTAILEYQGFSATAAYNAQSALDMARSNPPALLITDVVMPGMTGVELAIALKKTVPHCKILLFSGQAATADLLSEARGEGHNFTVLSKPVHPTELLAKVSAMGLTSKDDAA